MNLDWRRIITFVTAISRRSNSALVRAVRRVSSLDTCRAVARSSGSDNVKAASRCAASESFSANFNRSGLKTKEKIHLQPISKSPCIFYSCSKQFWVCFGNSNSSQFYFIIWLRKCQKWWNEQQSWYGNVLNKK